MTDFELPKELVTKVAKYGDAEKKLVAIEGAAKHFDRQRYGQAEKALGPLVEEMPEVFELKELLGLCCYRLGKYKNAIKYLTAFSNQTKSVEQHPVLIDCYRARQNFEAASRFWEELSNGKPEAHILIEGRVVFAGALVDQGELGAAEKLLSSAIENDSEKNKRGKKQGASDSTKTPSKPLSLSKLLPKRPSESEIRQVYMLADIYERGGHFIKASELFQWVTKHDPDNNTDASERILD